VSAVHRGWRVAEDAKSSLKIDEYLEKPFRISEVTAVVTRLLAATTSVKRDPEALGDEAKKYVEEGIEAYRAGDLKRATVALKRATEVDPLAFRARYHLGLLYAKAGKPFDAIGELERAVELNPGSFPTLKNLAVLYEQTGFKNKAAEVWERSLQATTDEAVQKEVRDHVLRLLQ
jgi:Tfp pilus assembly protein PilF